MLVKVSIHERKNRRPGFLFWSAFPFHASLSSTSVAEKDIGHRLFLWPSLTQGIYPELWRGSTGVMRGYHETS